MVCERRTDADAIPDSNPNADRNSNPNANSDPDANFNSNADTDCNPDADTDCASGDCYSAHRPNGGRRTICHL